jgi:hypothetical protein
VLALQTASVAQGAGVVAGKRGREVLMAKRKVLVRKKREMGSE